MTTPARETSTAATPPAAASPGPTAPPGMRVFLIICLGQFVSLVGSELTAFALGVWAFRQTGSATSFTLIMVFAQLPIVLLVPFAGAYVDRWDRRRTLIAANAFAASAVALLAVLVAVDAFRLWMIYPTIGAVAVTNAFHWPAFATVAPLVVAKEQLTRAAGMVELSSAVAKTIAPSLATFLVGAFALTGVLLVDTGTFLFAIATLLLVRIPQPAAAAGAKPPLMEQVREGWRYILDRPGLFRLLMFFLVNNLFVVFPLVLAVPLVASFTSTRTLGLVVSAGAAGLILGAIMMSTWGGPQRKIYGVIGAGALLGVSSVLAGLRPSPVLVALALFAFNFAIPVLNSSNQAIWQLKVAPQVQGRVFALRRMVGTATAPIGFLAAGPLADYVFDPLLRTDGGLAGSVGRLLGTGPGRGIGLMFVLFGLICIAVAVVACLTPRLVRLESELPDETGSR